MDQYIEKLKERGWVVWDEEEDEYPVIMLVAQLLPLFPDLKYLEGFGAVGDETVLYLPVALPNLIEITNINLSNNLRRAQINSNFLTRALAYLEPNHA